MWRGAIVNNPVKSLTMGSLLSFISWWFRPLYDPSEIDVGLGLDSLGADYNEHPCVDRTVFHDHFRVIRNRLLKDAGVSSDVYDPSRHEVYRRCLLQAAYMAYEAARGRNAEAMTCMLFPTHSCAPEDVADLVLDFPEHRFIYMIRHPVAVYNSAVKSVSLLARETPGAIDVFQTCINQVLLDEAPQVHGRGVRVYSLYKYPAVHNDFCVAVRLEDLHNNGPDTMAKLAQWLGIIWSDTLLESTFSGKIWWNRPMSKKINGLNKEMANLFNLENTSGFDRSRINSLTYRIRMHYNYKENNDKIYFYNIINLFMCIIPFMAEFKKNKYFELYGWFALFHAKYYMEYVSSYFMSRISIFRSIKFLRKNHRDFVRIL